MMCGSRCMHMPRHGVLVVGLSTLEWNYQRKRQKGIDAHTAMDISDVDEAIRFGLCECARAPRAQHLKRINWNAWAFDLVSGASITSRGLTWRRDVDKCILQRAELELDQRQTHKALTSARQVLDLGKEDTCALAIVASSLATLGRKKEAEAAINDVCAAFYRLHRSENAPDRATMEAAGFYFVSCTDYVVLDALRCE